MHSPAPRVMVLAVLIGLRDKRCALRASVVFTGLCIAKCGAVVYCIVW